MKKILIIQTASIGDVILSTPVIERLHAVYPDANIDFLLKKGNEQLFINHPFLHQLYIWNKKERKLRNLFSILKQIRKKRYDLLINIQRFASSGVITVFSGAKKTIGFNKNPFSIFFSLRKKHQISDGGNGVHEVIRNLKLVEDFPGDKSFKVRLYPSQNDFALMSQYKTHQYICVAPASLWFTKQYPEGRWIEFLQQLGNEIYVYFIGGGADKELCDRIIKSSKHTNCINFAGKLSFLQTTALMKDAKMNYTNDSAPMHLASSVDASVAAIFCSTVPAFGFGPLSDDSTIVEIDDKLDCRPCGLHGHKACPESHFRCALDINTKQLLDCIE